VFHNSCECLRRCNPERNENPSEADQAKGNATRFLGRLATQPLRRWGQREGGGSGGLQVDQSVRQGLQVCCAIGPCRDDPVVNPLDVEDTINCLQKVEYEKRELSRKFNEPSKWQQKNCQAEHVDASRPLKQLPMTVWKRHPVPSYVPADPDKFV